MNFKKYLKSYLRAGEERSAHGQAIVEYILIFALLAAMIIVVFGGFNPDNLTPAPGKGLTGVFKDSVNGVIDRIRTTWN